MEATHMYAKNGYKLGGNKLTDRLIDWTERLILEGQNRKLN